MATQIPPTLKTYTGEGVKIELYRDGDALVYSMIGQSIAEQVGTSWMSDAALLITLLSPMGLAAENDGSIVVEKRFPDVDDVGLGGLKFLIGIERDAVTDAVERVSWDEANAEFEARNGAHRQAMIEAGRMTVDGDPILPDWFSDDLDH